MTEGVIDGLTTKEKKKGRKQAGRKEATARRPTTLKRGRKR
jgi:hypothetical protein